MLNDESVDVDRLGARGDTYKFEVKPPLGTHGVSKLDCVAVWFF
jgi:hypothetical protein